MRDRLEVHANTGGRGRIYLSALLLMGAYAAVIDAQSDDASSDTPLTPGATDVSNIIGQSQYGRVRLYTCGSRLRVGRPFILEDRAHVAIMICSSGYVQPNDAYGTPLLVCASR